jgi:hypothetical protein
MTESSHSELRERKLTDVHAELEEVLIEHGVGPVDEARVGLAVGRDVAPHRDAEALGLDPQVAAGRVGEDRLAFALRQVVQVLPNTTQADR